MLGSWTKRRRGNTKKGEGSVLCKIAWTLSLIFYSSKTICLSIDIFLDVLSASWICRLVSDINLGNSQSLVSHISFPFFLLVFPLWIHYTFCSCSTVLGYSVLFFQSLFSLCFSFGDFYWYVLKAWDSSLSYVQSSKSIKCILPFVTVVLISHFLFVCFLKISISSADTVHVFLHAVFFSH